MQHEISYIGKIVEVNSAVVEIELDSEITSFTRIIDGRLYKIGQLGTFVKFPMGNLTLYGVVSAVSNRPGNGTANLFMPDLGRRYLQVQLIGERLGDLPFERGVGVFPTIQDEAHLVTEDDLKHIYGEDQAGLIEIGKHAASENLSVFLDLHHLVSRHCAILGSTGSGKSNTAATIIKQIMQKNPGSRIVLVDLHGEYAAAFENQARVLRIHDQQHPLTLPFWAMTFDELAFFLVGRIPGQEKPEDKRLRDTILSLKQKNAVQLKAGAVDPEFITPDAPIPFDIRKMWHDFNREVHGTYSQAQKEAQNRTTEELIDEGDPQKLVPARFKPYTPTNGAPFKSKNDLMANYEQKIHSRLKDSRYDFLFDPNLNNEENDLDQLLRDWIENDHRLTILDLSGIPFELIDISVGLLTRIVFDSMYWGQKEPYTGRNRPLLMVFEEAHSYLPKNEESHHLFGYARKAVERIFKEGRKFGLGALVVSQRPSEISETILAQVGTFIAMRLTNSLDKNTVKAAAPDNMTSLIDQVSALRIGEAIVVGEAIKIPSRVKIEPVSPGPNSHDPAVVRCWQQIFPPDAAHYQKIVTALREQKNAIADDISIS